jgi:hypothetical protein
MSIYRNNGDSPSQSFQNNKLQKNSRRVINWNFSSIDNQIGFENECEVLDSEEKLDIDTSKLTRISNRLSLRDIDSISSPVIFKKAQTIDGKLNPMLSIKDTDACSQKESVLRDSHVTEPLVQKPKSSVMSFKKMNPEIQEALIKSKLTSNDIGASIKPTKTIKNRYEGIKKCFDVDEDEDGEES